MAGWTAGSIFLTPNMLNILKGASTPVPGTLTPEQKLKLSGGVTRQALTAQEPITKVTPGATNNVDVTVRNKNVVPAATNPSTTAPAATTPSSNLPPFLQGNQNQSTGGIPDLMSLLSDILGGNKAPAADPKLVEAQTALAQQQAIQVARDNQAARDRQANIAAQGYLQSQLKDASEYRTGSVGNILTQKYNDRLKVLQSGQELNWLTMPSSTFSTPRRSGWTGPAMPGSWSI